MNPAIGRLGERGGVSPPVRALQPTSYRGSRPPFAKRQMNSSILIMTGWRLRKGDGEIPE